MGIMDDRMKIARAVGNWILESVGVWVMFCSLGVLMYGPGMLSIASGMAAFFTIGYLIYKAGRGLV